MTLTDKIKDIVNTLNISIDDANIDYALEKITLLEKREQIKSSKYIANFRINQAIKSSVTEILHVLKDEKAIAPILTKVKKLLNEQL